VTRHDADTVRSTEKTSAYTHRRLDIQGLRAIAVIMVVAFHAGLPFPGGFVGVDVFFVISGFVIAAMLHREWLLEGRLDFGRFYLRRFMRLAPALALMISVTVVTSSVVLSPLGPQQVMAQTAIGATFLSANLVIFRMTGGYFDAPAEINPLLNTWSLSIEEQFYLVFPFVLVAGWMLSRNRVVFRFSPFILVSIVAVLSFALTLASASGATFKGSGFITGFYSPFTRAWEFAVGALLALILARWNRVRLPVLLTILGFAGSSMLIASLFLITSATPFPGPWTLLPVGGTLLLILAGTAKTVPTSRILSHKILVRIGDCSYSIYLWHWPIIVFALVIWPDQIGVALAAAAISTVPALLSYRWIEQPIRKVPKLSFRKLILLIVTTIFVPLTLAVSVGLTASQYWTPKVGQIAGRDNPQHPVYILECDLGFVTSNNLPPPCEWNAETGGRPVYLLGDSNAAHFVGGLADATEELARPLVVTTGSSCPFLDLHIVYQSDPKFGTQCADFNARLLSWVVSQSPGTVILSQSDGYWLLDGYAVVGEGGVKVNDKKSRIQLMGQSLARTVSQLQSAGHEVVLIQTVPHFFGDFAWNPDTCSFAKVMSSECFGEMPLEASRKYSSDVIKTVNDIGLQTDSVVLDLAAEICPNNLCKSQNPEMAVYRDSIHISVPMSHSLADNFKVAIDKQQGLLNIR